MKTKVCSKCKEEKEISEFGKNKSSSDGLNYCCKECARIKSKEWVNKNPEKRREIRFKFNEKYRDDINAKNREYKRKNKESHDEYNKGWRQRNPDKCRVYTKNYRDRNKDRLAEERQQRWQNDIVFKLASTIRHNIWFSFKNKGFSKDSSTLDILGCGTFEYFQDYIVNQFDDGMTLDNYGTYWVFDHVMPISFALTIEEVEMLCSYRNFQPLTVEENNKKSNNIFYSEKTLQKCFDVWL